MTVGRLSPTKPAEVVLGWSPAPDSSAPTSLDIDDLEPDDRLLFAAGTEWRLIGTYNSVDAHRVFRLGLALGRRFAQVPMPAPDAAEFRHLLDLSVDQTWEPGDRELLLDVVGDMYAIHGQAGGAALGPAPFLTIPPHVRAAADDHRHDVRELIAEAYLSAFGTWLARQDEPFLDKIGAALGAGAVLGSQWQWVRTHLASLA